MTLTVRELIDYLSKCDETLPVYWDCDCDLTNVREHLSKTDPNESHVEIS